jgi:hypothetical protein
LIFSFVFYLCFLKTGEYRLASEQATGTCISFKDDNTCDVNPDVKAG